MKDWKNVQEDDMKSPGRALSVRSVMREADVVTKAVARTADILEITNAELGHILGVSESTSSRLRSGSFTLKSGTKEMELAVLLIRIFRGLDAIVGGDEMSIRSWLNVENLALRGVPLEIMKTITGINSVVLYMDARRACI